VSPVDDPLALHQAHRSFDEKRLLERLTEGLANLPGRLSNGVRRLALARQRVISDPVAEFIQLLRVAHLPKRLLLDLQTAYAAEPEQTAFGISQAVTRASQKMPPEERFELDRREGNAKHVAFAYCQHVPIESCGRDPSRPEVHRLNATLTYSKNTPPR
jgi:hypothetical protein